MNNLKHLVTFFLLVLISGAVQSGVNIKNGNFYISYQDISVSRGGKKLTITRTYNSKSKDYNGWFGMGWGSDYETFLTVSADGSIVIHENGSGAKTRFIPEKGKVNAAQGAQQIVDAMKKENPALTKAGAKKWLQRLKKNAELRQAYARRYNVGPKLAKGTTFTSTRRGPQKIVFLGNSYERRYTNGRVETFNKEGKLTSIKEQGGYTVSLNYDKKSRLKSIKDTEGNQLFFAWNASGNVQNIWSTKESKVSYTYNDNNNLIQSQDVEKNVYKYTYNKHNMTSIEYSDKSSQKITYDPKTQFVSSVTNRRGKTTKYKYDSNPKNRDLHYWTLVTRQGLNGKNQTNRFEYEIKARSDGSRYDHRIVTSINGVSTETIYSENCNLPLKITRGKKVTTFKYTDKCLLKEKKSTSGEQITFRYHKKLSKITRAVTKDGWSAFDYDSKTGLLSRGTNSDGESVALFYDRNNRIKRMIASNKKSKKKETLDFKYNSLDKPVEIAMKGTGKINISYNNNGEIKDINSKSGDKMAKKINSTFRSLLTIVRSAGVTLNI